MPRPLGRRWRSRRCVDKRLDGVGHGHGAVEHAAVDPVAFGVGIGIFGIEIEASGLFHEFAVPPREVEAEVFLGQEVESDVLLTEKAVGGSVDNGAVVFNPTA